MSTTTPKIFGQAKPAAATPTTLFTVPGASTAQVNIYVANQSSAIDRFNIELIPSGQSPDDKQYIAYDTPLTGNGVFSVAGIALSGGDMVMVSTTSGNCSITGTGLQFDP